jgi:DNA polymerase elongation subunit (family B)
MNYPHNADEFTKVLDLAIKFEVDHKIDVELLKEDEEYRKNWSSVLSKLGEFKERCNLCAAKDGLTIHDIKNVRSFSSDAIKYNEVIQRLHETFDDFPELTKTDKYVKSDTVATKCAYDKNITSNVHVVDVDYEYDYNTGMNIILYTRVIGSDDTIFVRCPYYDYFYIQVTDEITPKLIRERIKSYCWFLKNIKYKAMAEKVDFKSDNRRHPINVDYTNKPLVISMEVVHGLKSMYGYQPDEQTFVKIITANPSVTIDLFNGLTKKFDGAMHSDTNEDPITGKMVENGVMKYYPEMKIFEAKIDVTNKFLTEHKISGCSAVTVKGVRIGEGKSPYSTCTVAMDCTDVIPLVDAPFYEPRTLFYDIECLSLDVNEFPTAERCPIIQISYLLARGTATADQGVICYKETPGYDWYDTEEQLLIAFAKRIIDFNPDYITGFNSNCFDMPYILDRMEVLGISHVASCWSRRLGLNVSYKRDFKESKQFGTKEIVKYITPGRVMFDQMEIIKNNPMIRLRSYALKNICAEFLGDDNKEDLRYRDIPELFTTVEGRQKIASYCLQDTVLLKKLDDKMMMGVDIAGQAKVQGITPNVVLNRGLVFRIMCKIKQYTEKYNFLIPSFTKKQFPNSPTYQGATVLNCDAGYYTDPVVVLDFASLYPSLIRSYNLDYTTIAMDTAVVEKYPERFQKFDNGYAFVKAEYLRGLLPRIEAELAVERTNAKKRMKNAGDDVEKAVWNAIQGGVKVVMNSIYGLSGSPTATVPCVPIAATITFMGRVNLQASKDYVETNFCRITGEPPERQCRVIYGDTVSLFFYTNVFTLIT